MATDPLSIFLASSCIGSFWGNARTGLQSIQPYVPAASIHGLSAQNGALRPLLCTSEMEFCLRIFNSVRAVTWPPWHGRRRHVEMDGTHEKWSFTKQADFTGTAL